MQASYEGNLTVRGMRLLIWLAIFDLELEWMVEERGREWQKDTCQKRLFKSKTQLDKLGVTAFPKFN